MNQHLATAKAFPGIIGESPIVQRRYLLAAIGKHSNNDDVSRDLAIDAIAAGRAAFWTTAGYSNQCAANLLNDCNKGNSVENALLNWFAGRSADFKIRAGLDTLIPLNTKASIDLAAAYELCGTFRNERELEKRRAA